MPQKSPAENKPLPITTVWFNALTKLPGKSGAWSQLTTKKSENTIGWGTNFATVSSLHIVGNLLMLDGTYFMPLDGGNVAWFQY